jgi:hypothetical protein
MARHPRLMSCGVAGLLALGSTRLCAAAAHEAPTRPPLSGTPYLVVIDNKTYADTALREKLNTYFQNVNQLFNLAPSVVEVEPLDPTAPGKGMSAIRDTIKQNYERHHIAGVMLVGRIPYMTWRQAAGGNWVNYGTEDFYYADLDAEFLDQETRYGNDNSDIRAPASAQGHSLDNQLVPGKEHTPDGQYDTYLRGENEGPEIWVSRICATNTAHYYAFFDKANTYYSNIVTRLAADRAAQVVPYKNMLYAGHSDYAPSARSGKYQFLKTYNDSLPGSRYVVLGQDVGCTKEELFSSYADTDYLFAEVDGHADPYGHEMRGGRYSVSDVLTKLQPGRGALIQALWGCHSGDFIGLKSNLLNLTMAYVLSPGITQASYGCSWTSGTEEVEAEVLQNLARGDYLGLAFQRMQKRLYSKAYMERFFDNESRHLNHFLPANADHAERMEVLMTRLLRGYNLIGNPFLKIAYSNPEQE